MKVDIEWIQKNIPLYQVVDCFFAGSSHGYAGGGKYIPVDQISGMKCFTYNVEYPQLGYDLRFSDAYVSLGPESGGYSVISLVRTTVSCDPVPLWLMQYEGKELSKDPAIIGLLKEALLSNYSAKVFRGGRGPAQVVSNNFPELCYENRLNINVRPGIGNGFSAFSGTEVVIRPDQSTEFYHNYNGKLLVELK